MADYPVKLNEAQEADLDVLLEWERKTDPAITRRALVDRCATRQLFIDATAARIARKQRIKEALDGADAKTRAEIEAKLGI